MVDIQPLEKPNPPQAPPKKSGKKVFKSIFRKKTSESCSNTERDYDEPDVVEELFEEGSASLSDRSCHALYSNMPIWFLYTYCVY